MKGAMCADGASNRPAAGRIKRCVMFNHKRMEEKKKKHVTGSEIKRNYYI